VAECDAGAAGCVAVVVVECDGAAECVARVGPAALALADRVVLGRRVLVDRVVLVTATRRTLEGATQAAIARLRRVARTADTPRLTLPMDVPARTAAEKMVVERMAEGRATPAITMEITAGMIAVETVAGMAESFLST